MLDFIIVVNDNSELKTISATRLEQSAPHYLMENLDRAINHVLDNMSEAEEAQKSLEEYLEKGGTSLEDIVKEIKQNA